MSYSNFFQIKRTLHKITNKVFVFEYFAVLTAKCTYLSNDKYEYKTFIPLSDIRDSHPNEYIARLAIYAQGARDAHILLSSEMSPEQGDDVYEFCKYNQNKGNIDVIHDR